MKTEPAVEETISQSEPQLQNTDVGPSHQDEASAANHLQSTNDPNNQSLHKDHQEIENNLTELENLYPQTCLQNEGGCDSFKEASEP